MPRCWPPRAPGAAPGGCCGLAGNFGVEKGHYEVSVAVADLELRPAVAAAGPQTTILADGYRAARSWPT